MDVPVPAALAAISACCGAIDSAVVGLAAGSAAVAGALFVPISLTCFCALALVSAGSAR